MRSFEFHESFEPGPGGMARRHGVVTEDVGIHGDGAGDIEAEAGLAGARRVEALGEGGGGGGGGRRRRCGWHRGPGGGALQFGFGRALVGEGGGVCRQGCD